MVSRHAFTRVLQATHMPYESPAGKDFMKDMITMMHLARTEEHFDLMASVGLATLRSNTIAEGHSQGPRIYMYIRIYSILAARPFY